MTAVVALIWAGMIVGISFFEAPIKFRAPALSREVGLQVGSFVFGAFHKAQWVLALLMGAGLALGAPTWAMATLGGACALLLLQQLGLQPILDARVRAIAAGEAPSRSHLHVGYVASEALKLTLLIATGIALRP